MKKMLINAANADEWRVALIENDSLYDLDIELPGQEQTTANIYQARVSRVEPSLGAAFMEYGGNRHGFLSIKDVAPQYFPNGVKDNKLSIGDVLREGQEFIVQVEKEERGTKGAALTTYISLAGCYMVLMPNNPDAGGISRRIDGAERDDLRTVVEKLHIPENMGVIIRTAGVGKSLEDLQWDLDSLLCVWEAIQQASQLSKSVPYLIHQESNVVIRAMRDHLRPDIESIIIDNAEAFEQLQRYLKDVRPNYADKVQLHQEKSSLFSHYKIESQTETVFQREVRLPSGGALVIDSTEALIAIDINSSRATKGKDIEETALKTNLEAAKEIARQLRLRDLGGLIIIDFIDMLPTANKRAVEKRLREELRHDRARIQVGSISRFGLLEMSRQRLRSALRDSRQMPCPRCHGHGVVRSVAALAPSLLRLIEEEAAKDSTAQVIVQVPTEVATCLFNEKRQAVSDIEKNYNIGVIVVANSHLDTPNYELKSVTVHEYATKGASVPSYELVQQPEVVANVSSSHNDPAPSAQPAVNLNLPTHAAPRKRSRRHQTGLLQRMLKALFGEEKPKPSSKKQATQNNNRRRQQKSGGSQRSANGNRRNNQSAAGRSPSRSRNTNNTNNKSQGRNQSRQTDSGATKTKREAPNRQDNGRSNNRRTESRSDERSSTAKHTNKRPRNANQRQQEAKSTAAPRQPAPATTAQKSRAEQVQQPVPVKRQVSDPVASKPVDQQPPVQAVAKPVKKASLPPPPVSSTLLEDSKLKLVQVETGKKDSDE